MTASAPGACDRAAGRNDHSVTGDRDRRVRRSGEVAAIDDRAGLAVQRDQYAVVQRCEDEIVGRGRAMN